MEPMSDERLSQIRRCLTDIFAVWYPRSYPESPAQALSDLLAEVERLQLALRQQELECDALRNIMDWMQQQSQAREAALLAEREQALAIIRRVARISSLTATPGAPGGGVFNCPFCGEQPFKQFDNDPWMDAGWEHTSDCIVTKARALLAATPGVVE